MGGTWDHKSQQMVWTAHVPVAEQPAFYDVNPPRALAELICTPTPLPGFEFDGHGEPVNAVFAISCPCGGDLFTPYAMLDDDGTALPPVVLACAGCGRECTVFDARIHGWDGALGNAPDDEPTGDREQLDASEIATPHQILIRFEMASDVLGDPEWKGREQDLFSWITVIGRDADSQELEQLFDWECS